MNNDNISAAVKELQTLCANAKEVESQGCEVVKNTFLGGMKDGESWGLRKWLSKQGGALHICNDTECLSTSCQKLDRELDSTRKLAERLRPLAASALKKLKSEIPSSYQEQSSAHPYLPFFHRLECALRGMANFDPEDDDVICIIDDDEVEELKAKSKASSTAPQSSNNKRKKSRNNKASAVSASSGSSSLSNSGGSSSNDNKNSSSKKSNGASSSSSSSSKSKSSSSSSSKRKAAETFVQDDDDYVDDDDDDDSDIEVLERKPRAKRSNISRNTNADTINANSTTAATTNTSTTNDDSVNDYGLATDDTGDDSDIMQQLLKTLDDDNNDDTMNFDQFEQQSDSDDDGINRASNISKIGAYDLADGLDSLASLFDSKLHDKVRPDDIEKESFWDDSYRYASALRLFSEILREPDCTSLFLETVDEDELIQEGKLPYNEIVKHPLCFRDIVSALLQDFNAVDNSIEGSNGVLPVVTTLHDWNMWKGMELLQAIDLVFLNALAYGKANDGAGSKSNDRSRTNKLRKLLWAGIKEVIDGSLASCDAEERRRCTPTRRGESSGFVVRKGS